MGWFAASHLVSVFTGGGLLKLFFGNLMGDLKAVVAFLRQHSIWLTVSIALCLAWGVDHVVSHRHAAKLENQLTAAIASRDHYKHQLDGISTARDTQKIVTKTNVETVTRIIHDADGTAHAIEQAPALPGCQTPKVILDANI